MEDLQYLEQLLYSVSGYISEQYSNRKNLVVSTKRHANDLLTEVDVNVQRMLVKEIGKEYPNDLILAEESGLDTLKYTSENRCWIIDPIDGTQNFVRGLFPEFGVSIGLTVGGIPEVGGILFPISGDLFLAKRGGGAFQNGQRIKVSDTSTLSGARVDIDMGGLDNRDMIMQHTKKIAGKAGQLRTYGCSVMGFCQVANGEQDAYIVFTVNPWDVAAGMLLVQEAGGKVSSFSEEISSPFDAKKIRIVSNNNLHSVCAENLL